MYVPEWAEELWHELRFMQLVDQETGLGYQHLFNRVMKAVDGDDFVATRSLGRRSDLKCDGWGTASRTCYAVYGPFVRKAAKEVNSKITSDFYEAAKSWPEMRNWRFVHNDRIGLGATVLSALGALREDARISAPHITILPPWGPVDLWRMLSRTPRKERLEILGTHGWQLNPDRVREFVGIGNDPVSSSAGRSVAQLLDGFSSGGLLNPLSATAFAGAVAAFLLGDSAAFQRSAGLLEQRCHDDPFETMLTAVTFVVIAGRLWLAATQESPQFLTEMLIASGATIPYIVQIVMSAGFGNEEVEPIPGHPDDQQKVTMNLGQVAALILQLTADHRGVPVVSVLQDLLIGVQREPAGETS